MRYPDPESLHGIPVEEAAVTYLDRGLQPSLQRGNWWTRLSRAITTYLQGGGQPSLRPRRRPHGRARPRPLVKLPQPSPVDLRPLVPTIEANARTTVEPSVRTRLLDSFLRCPHRDLAAFQQVHLHALQRDPLLYGHLARWYFTHGAVRDHQELFAAHLLTSPLPMHRDHGFVLLQTLRAYQVARVVRYCKTVLHFVPRSLGAAVRRFLRDREASAAWLDECVIRDRRSMKYLYASMHVRPGPRAEQIIFEDRPPADSRVAAVHQLARLADDPARQAELILQHRIHFTTALGTVKHFTPTVLYALVNVMTPQQVINHLQFLEKRGALTHPITREVVDARLKAAVSEGRVSDVKARVALAHIQPDPRLAEELLQITEQRLRNRGRLDVPTALLVDKSGSMQQCVEIGKLLAVLCSTIADSDLWVYAFDNVAFEVRSSAPTFAAWERAFAPIRADGATSVGAALVPLLSHRIEQIVIISDGEENSRPHFHEVLDDYEKHHGFRPRVVFVKVGHEVSTSLGDSVPEMEIIAFNGDYYSLPNIVPLLCPATRHALLKEVLEMPLYTREDVATLPPRFNEETFDIL